jgi:aminoglycoside phosphotransferase family enzyme
MQGEAYPESPGKIDLIQTHISYVILTDKYVYKIKKPVDFGFLDFTSLDKRRFYCQQEVDLNQRLSPDIYLEVVDVRKKKGHFVYDGDGEVVDYAVKMKRLPDDKMMINLLKEEKLTAQTVDQIAEILAHFHDEARSDSVVSSFGTFEAIRKNVAENFKQTEKYIGKTISEDEYNTIKNFSELFLEERETLFSERVARGRIKECHGDLHMEHLYLMDKIYIIDCIEFNERFRYSDVAADIAFLAMDLDFHGHGELSKSFVESYIKYSGDTEMAAIIDFYKCYRAYVRGKVDSFELDDTTLEEGEKNKAAEIAKRYFKLAYSYVR